MTILWNVVKHRLKKVRIKLTIYNDIALSMSQRQAWRLVTHPVTVSPLSPVSCIQFYPVAHPARLGHYGGLYWLDKRAIICRHNSEWPSKSTAATLVSVQWLSEWQTALETRLVIKLLHNIDWHCSRCCLIALWQARSFLAFEIWSSRDSPPVSGCSCSSTRRVAQASDATHHHVSSLSWNVRSLLVAICVRSRQYSWRRFCRVCASADISRSKVRSS